MCKLLNLWTKESNKKYWELNYNFELNSTLCIIKFIIQKKSRREQKVTIDLEQLDHRDSFVKNKKSD